MLTPEGDTAHEPVMLSALQHFSYCPRQYALIHLEQAFEDNHHTLLGQAVHKRVDVPGQEQRPQGVRVLHALALHEPVLGLVGRADVVEIGPEPDKVRPVEYKHGKKRDSEHDDLQLAGQALCLEHMMGVPVTEGVIYSATSHRRREVKIDARLRQRVIDTIAQIRQIMAAGQLPPPANDARCRECAQFDICQPKLIGRNERLEDLRANLFRVDTD